MVVYLPVLGIQAADLVLLEDWRGEEEEEKVRQREYVLFLLLEK
jgi:hypothetical protein